MPNAPRKGLMPHAVIRPVRPPASRPRTAGRPLLAAGSTLLALTFVGASLLALPKALEFSFARTPETVAEAPSRPPFPVTVDPVNETIIEDPAVEALLEPTHGTLAAAAGFAGGGLAWLANLVASIPGYSQLAGADIAFVNIRAGYREEEVARAFGSALGWTRAEEAAFLKRVHEEEPTLLEGEFVPGIYSVSGAATAPAVQQILHDRYREEVAERYDPEQEAILPLRDVLTIASLLQKETKDPGEMRLISGIIWNRLWTGMNLQIDATLQYAKADAGLSKEWWPVPVPDDKYIKSPYNTYRNGGLPPGPIANPSTEAIIAALNPRKTECMFYFHDSRGRMHCTETYAQHVALLRKYYGQGR